MQFILRVRGSLTYGWGHLVRAYSLAEHLAAQTETDVILIVEGDETVRAFAAQHALAYKALEMGTPLATEQELLRDHNPDVIIVDALDMEPERLELYARLAPRLVLFNDLGSPCTFGDIIIVPQCLASYPKPGKDQELLAGPAYFILSNNLRAHARRRDQLAATPRRLLVALGGALRAPLMRRTLEVLEQLSGSIREIDFLIGYDHDFDPAEIDFNHPAQLNIIPGTADLGPLMAGADLALAASGYVKYELAAVGTPAILVSIVDHQDMLGRAFQAHGECAHYVGDIYSVPPRAVATALDDLAHDRLRRQSMAERGQALVDGRGVERIAAAVARSSSKTGRG